MYDLEIIELPREARYTITITTEAEGQGTHTLPLGFCC